MKKKTTKAAMVKQAEYVIVRGSKSGVNVGEFAGIKGGLVRLKNSRRIWSWDGAAELNEIAVYGCNPERREGSRISVVIETKDIPLQDVGEIIVCQKAGEEWLRNAPEWRA
jgi:hypothetical protein